MVKSPDGYFTLTMEGVAPGSSYSFLVDGSGPFPDPASRYQPAGVHCASVVVDPNNYQWRDTGWTGIALRDAVFYELHVGTFTPQGTFQAAASKLLYLKDLGITVIELMPLSDFPGARNWGYDGVAPFAPAHCYGSPDDLRSFVDQAHQLGLAVFLDVVYNHFGPDGAYQRSFSTHYFTPHHHTPWGNGVNFDDRLCQPVREYVIENALRWFYEYHFDGLRLDATAEIRDDSPRHILAALTSAASRASEELGRLIHVVAEESRNLASHLKPESAGGMGFAGVWADDFHHQMRRALAGDSDGYFAEFEGSLDSVVKTVKRGWWRGKSDPFGIPYFRFVYCLQNHDQIGNRALGDRLHHLLDWPVYRAATTLLLLLPQTPLLFMGQEWAATTPFLYFTDHHDELGRAVTEGRRREFASFASFAHAEIPDPQSSETFRASKLRWDELATPPHCYMLNLYKSLLRLRRDLQHHPPSSPDLRIEALDDTSLLLHRNGLSAAIRLRGQGKLNIPFGEPILTTEDPQFTHDSQPIQLNRAAKTMVFSRPGAVVFRTQHQEQL